MTTFISVEVGAGAAWLNVAHVVAIAPLSDSACEVTFLTGNAWYMSESAYEVIDKLRTATVLDA